MIVDTSALVAVLRAEPEAPAMLQVLKHDRARAGAPTLLETAMVLGPQMSDRLDDMVDVLGLDVVPFDARHLDLARTAMAMYGKGRGHRAKLNFGDCMSYALAKVSGEPLLFKGDDFTHTDITPAWVPDGD